MKLSCFQPIWGMVYRPAKIPACTSRQHAAKKPVHIALWWRLWEQPSPVCLQGKLAFSKKPVYYPIYVSFVPNCEFLFALAATEARDKFAATTSNHPGLWGTHCCVKSHPQLPYFPPIVFPSCDSTYSSYPFCKQPVVADFYHLVPTWNNIQLPLVEIMAASPAYRLGGLEVLTG